MKTHRLRWRASFVTVCGRWQPGALPQPFAWEIAYGHRGARPTCKRCRAHERR